MTDIAQQWERFHYDNPGFYVLFCKLAHEALQAGRRRLSANMIFERIRWETTLSPDEDQYKVNNNYRAYYSRLFMIDKKRPGVFETRTIQVGARTD